MPLHHPSGYTKIEPTVNSKMAASYRIVTRENDGDSTVSRNVSDRYMIYIAPQKIQKRRRDILLMNSSKKGLNITNELR